MKVFDGVDDVLVESAMGVVDEVGDINQPVLHFTAAHALHHGHFDAVEYDKWPLVILEIFVPCPKAFDILLELLIFSDFLVNRPV